MNSKSKTKNRFLLISQAPIGDQLSYAVIGNGIRKEITMTRLEGRVKISYRFLSSDRSKEKWGVKEVPLKMV